MPLLFAGAEPGDRRGEREGEPPCAGDREREPQAAGGREAEAVVGGDDRRGDDQRDRAAGIAGCEPEGGEPVGIAVAGNSRQQAAGKDLRKVEAHGCGDDRHQDRRPR